MEWNFLGTKVIEALTRAAAILLIGFIIGKIVGRVLKRLLREVELNSTFKKAGLNIDIELIIGSFVSYFVYFITVVMVLNQLGLTTTMLYIVTAAVLLLVIISLSLAIKDFIPNFFGGMRLFYSQDILVGDKIKVKDIEGKVVKITLLETQVETKKKDIIFVPNAMLSKNKVVKKH